jgi:hypothetical protein
MKPSETHYFVPILSTFKKHGHKKKQLQQPRVFPLAKASIPSTTFSFRLARAMMSRFTLQQIQVAGDVKAGHAAINRRVCPSRLPS